MDEGGGVCDPISGAKRSAAASAATRTEAARGEATFLRTTWRAMRQGRTFAVALVALSCSRGEGRRDAIEVLVPAAPQTLDPRYAIDAVGMRVTRLVHAGLVRLDAESLAPVPYAAASWTWDDETHLRVLLRRDVRFSSGAPLEARDVCATLAAFADPALGSPHRGVTANIAACDEVSPGEVVLTQRERRATLLTDLEVPILRRDEAAAPPRAEGVLDGLGPFALRSSSHDFIELAARAGSPLPRPAHDVAIRVVHDENARAVRLLAGRADVVPNGLSPVLLDAVEREGARVVARGGSNLTYLAVASGRGAVSSLDARRGLDLAIDRALLVRTLLGGRARVASGVLPPESWVAPAPRPSRFAPAEARPLFASAGLARATLLVSSDRARGVLARAIAQMLGDVGVAIEVVPLELGVLLHRLAVGDFELAILQIPEITEPDLLRWFFHSAYAPTTENGMVGANRTRYASAAVDRLLEAGRTAVDHETRAPAYRAVVAELARDLPVIPLFHEDQIAALSTRAATFRPSAEGRWLGLAALP